MSLNIQPLLDNVNNIIKKGFHDILHEHLKRSYEKSKQEMEYYKRELDNLRNFKSMDGENISLNIEEKSEFENDPEVQHVVVIKQ